MKGKIDQMKFAGDSKQFDKDENLLIELYEGGLQVLGQKSGNEIKQEQMKKLHYDLKQKIESSLHQCENKAYGYLEKRFSQYRKKSDWKLQTHKDTKLLNVDFELELLYSCLEEKEFCYLVHKKIINYLQCKLDDVQTNKGSRSKKMECQIQEHTCGPIHCPLQHKTVRSFKFPNVMMYRKHMMDFHQQAFYYYQCPLCEYGPQATQVEFLNHIKDRHQTLMCFCKKAFITQLQLSIHVRQCLCFFREAKDIQGTPIYDGKNPSCNLCSIVVRKKDFITHMLNKHSMTPNFICCCICMEICPDIEQFVKHMKTQHIMIKCTCLKQFTNFEKFSEHATRCLKHFKPTGNAMTID